MKRLLVLLLPTILFAAPAQVILLRHAEKPSATPSLSLKGRERAAAFVPFFNSAPEVNFNGLPTAIFTPSDSLASVQTMQLLSEDIGVPLTKSYSTQQTNQLVDEILHNPDHEGHMLLICSGDSQIPKIAAKLGAKKAPKNWGEDDYDKLWILTFSDQGEVNFQNIPQKLLFGDSK
jgi:hypothetical protein